MERRQLSEALTERVTVRASFAWFGLVLLIVIFLAVFLWAFLDEPAHQMLTLSTTPVHSARGETSANRIRTIWELWPFWGAALASLLFAYRRAINETGRRL